MLKKHQKSWMVLENSINLHRFSQAIMGLTGFDSKLRWYVSTRSDGCKLLNTFGQKINWQQ